MANAILLIRPYWSSGTWVFDDPAAGLVREPFVCGIPQMIDRLVADAGIAEARKGFRLLFSATPFPGHQGTFKRLRAEHNGTWYRDESNGTEGWLCPDYSSTSTARLKRSTPGRRRLIDSSFCFRCGNVHTMDVPPPREKIRNG
jgi:hypothetical protein